MTFAEPPLTAAELEQKAVRWKTYVRALKARDTARLRLAVAEALVHEAAAAIRAALEENPTPGGDA